MERAKERFWNREGVQSYSISLSLRGWYSSRSSVRSDRILLGALTNQLGLYAFSQRTFFGGGEKDGRRGPFDKNRVFFFSSSPRNKKNSCAYITVPDFLNRKWESLYTYTHTHLSASAPSKPLTNSSMLLVWSKWSSITRHSFGGAQNTLGQTPSWPLGLV
jgi:hypothetical protein